MDQTEEQKRFVEIASQKGTKFEISRREINELVKTKKVSYPNWLVTDTSLRIRWGMYRLPLEILEGMEVLPPLVGVVDAPVVDEVSAPALMARTLPLRIQSVVSDLEINNLIPVKYEHYVPFGNFEDLKRIIGSNGFYPVFITGPSGNGKTMSVEQVCAQLKRKFVCISMTPETDESDLLGNYVLLDGTMVWRDGAVTVAARTGAVLCIDEIDYGAQNLSTLQRVLEGRPFLLKKKNEMVYPAKGFTIVATANTKGKGSEDGRYMFTNILNEAFLERFPITFEQEWAPMVTERKIIRKEMSAAGTSDVAFADFLVTWADTIRKTFLEHGCDEVISTRRLVHIAKAYGIFGDRMKAIRYCLNRFDEETKASFLDLYSKVDASVDPPVLDPQVLDPQALDPQVLDSLAPDTLDPTCSSAKTSGNLAI